MKTLSDLKRRLRVGTQLRVVDHFQEKYRGTIREVTAMQTNGYKFVTIEGSDKAGRGPAFSPYEKAKNITFPCTNRYRVDLPAEEHSPARWWELEITL